MVIAVVDESSVKAYSRMDGVLLLSVGIAQDKAYSAAAFGAPTHAIYDVIKADPPLLAGVPQVPRVVVFGGGYPVMQGGAVIGAIGMSGGAYAQDMEVAKAGLAALAEGRLQAAQRNSRQRILARPHPGPQVS